MKRGTTTAMPRRSDEASQNIDTAAPAIRAATEKARANELDATFAQLNFEQLRLTWQPKEQC